MKCILSKTKKPKKFYIVNIFLMKSRKASYNDAIRRRKSYSKFSSHYTTFVLLRVLKIETGRGTV